MTTANWRAWIWEYVLPTLLVISLGPVWVAIWGDLNILAFGLAFAIAVVTGFVLRPVHVWVMPAAVVVVFALVVYALEILGLSEPESNVGLIPGLTLVVGLPLLFCNWVGRGVRPNAPLHSWRRTGPHAPA